MFTHRPRGGLHGGGGGSMYSPSGAESLGGSSGSRFVGAKKAPRRANVGAETRSELEAGPHT